MNRLYGLNRPELTPVFGLFRNDSLDVCEVVPIQYHGSWRQVFFYGKILTQGLTKKEIKKIFEEANAKEIPDVIDKEDYFEIQYENKPSLLISKKDGKIYCDSSQLKKYDRRLIEHQASILITILNKGKRVDFLKRRTEGKRREIKFYG
jgi:hypothetical protein